MRGPPGPRGGPPRRRKAAAPARKAAGRGQSRAGRRRRSGRQSTAGCPMATAYPRGTADQEKRNPERTGRQVRIAGRVAVACCPMRSTQGQEGTPKRSPRRGDPRRWQPRRARIPAPARPADRSRCCRTGPGLCRLALARSPQVAGRCRCPDRPASPPPLLGVSVLGCCRQSRSDLSCQRARAVQPAAWLGSNGPRGRVWPDYAQATLTVSTTWLEAS
jgi:hypothetical protein